MDPKDLLGERLENPGYSERSIDKGVVGEASKILEELLELVEAEEQGVTIMALVELSDMYGAIVAYLEKHHPSITMADLAAMSKVTRRAFRSGRRT